MSEQRIVGFRQDLEQDWIAQLACGHTQHVRHAPPWQVRPWVLTPEGRAGRLGTSLPRRQCDAVRQRHMQEPRRNAGGPNALVLLLCVLAPTLGLLVWIFGSGAQRPVYLRSWWVRAGLVLLLVGAAPLVAIIVAAKAGLWPDPNPNPVGPGLLFFISGVVATVCLAIGAVWVWLDLRQPAP
jgi:hypothetical protein